jgi:hypothetical protein
MGRKIKNPGATKIKIGQALNYALNHKGKLQEYLKDGNCVISNNIALYTGYFYPHLSINIA